MDNTSPKMNIEIWSDIMCPFCYIGKRHYEAALALFPQKEHLNTIWKSFQLNPDIKGKTNNAYQYVADMKGISLEQSVNMHRGVVQMAANAGLDYHFDKVVIVNSFNAHRLIQLAKVKGLGDKAEEVLFHANFTEGLNYSDTAVLKDLAAKIGLTDADVDEAMTNDAYASAALHDMQEAQQIGVNGVPFFVFNRRYAISGAQPVPLFTDTLNKSFAEWQKDNPGFELNVSEGPACTPGGDCI